MSIHAYALTSVANVKTYLGITSSSDDALLEMFVNQTTDWIEQFCGGRRFKDTTYTDEIYESEFAKEQGDFPTIVRNRNYWLNCRQYPITATAAVVVKYRSGNTSWQTQEATGYEVYNNRGQVYLYGGMPNIRQAVKLTYSAGYATIPSDLELACIKLVARQYEKRKSQGKKSESIGGATIVWADVGAESVDGDVQSILDTYKRKPVV